MIRLLAELFREFHYIIGISLPPPSTSDRTFVFAWLSVIAIFTAFCAIMFVTSSLFYTSSIDDTLWRSKGTSLRRNSTR